jgi:hypothetical protein
MEQLPSCKYICAGVPKKGIKHINALTGELYQHEIWG